MPSHFDHRHFCEFGGGAPLRDSSCALLLMERRTEQAIELTTTHGEAKTC